MEFSPVCIDRDSLEISMGVVARILFDYHAMSPLTFFEKWVPKDLPLTNLRKVIAEGDDVTREDLDKVQGVDLEEEVEDAFQAEEGKHPELEVDEGEGLEDDNTPLHYDPFSTPAAMVDFD
jgi:hypothetical protein